MASKKTSEPKVPKEIFAQVSPKSIGGTSLFEYGTLATSENFGDYYSEKRVTLRAVEALKNAGFNILQVTNMTVNISGTEAAYKKAFNTEIYAKEVLSMKSGPEEENVTYLDTKGTDVDGLITPKSGAIADYIEGIAIEEPYYYFAPKPYPPLKEYWHLQVPAGVSLACNADKAHRAGITGKGVKVAMVDSGWYQHSFFTQRGYRTAPVTLAPGAANPTTDDNGHGTSESANIFATAPDTMLYPVKMSFVNTTAAFNAAVALNPDIITCSWGSSIRNPPLSAANQALAAAIAAAVASGITVVFSAGNGHYGYPGQHPDVISAGGVFMDENLNLRASDYSSGFDSNIYPGRTTPDVCGMVGMRPRAAYIMLPLQENSTIDSGSSGGNHPNGDETTGGDGWAAISGTSAAAPQLAGVAALLKQACPRLKPSGIRNLMKNTAIDVTQGTNNNGNTSVAGPDNSTGHGLINAQKAVMKAKLQCLFPQPIIPVVPVIPTPIVPITPITPVRPVVPLPPVRPVVPLPPVSPVTPIGPRDLEAADPAVSPAEAGSGYLTEEDVHTLMTMVDNNELDLTDLEE